MGKRRLVKSLGTADIELARARRWAVVAEMKAAIEEARRGNAVSALTEIGLTWRDMLAEASSGNSTGASDDGGMTTILLSDTLERIAEDKGETAAHYVADLAYGRATPLATFIDAWLVEGGARGPAKPRTQVQYRRDVGDLGDWLVSQGISATIEAVTRKIAGRYVTERLLVGQERKTANRKISAVSAYWRWLIKRGHAEANPWASQSVAKAPKGTADTGKRPFTNTEIVALLTGDTDQEMHDAMRVAALSGMRIEEIYRLTIADCADHTFNVRDAKTRAGIRRVPIHTALRGIIKRRTRGRQSDFVFPEGGPKRDGKERSGPLSKRFGRYRQSVNVHDRAEGRRQSAVDFHSFRRWFVTSARNAGIDRAVVAAVVGHQVGNLTDDTYSGGPSDALRVGCVEAVKMPKGVPAR